MRPHLIAAAIALVALALTWGLAEGISRDRPTHPGQDQIVATAVEAIAPTLVGGDCPDTTKLMPIGLLRIVTSLQRQAKRTPDRNVTAPNGDGEMRLADVPDALGEELARCIASQGSPGPGWERMVERLRQR